MICSKRKDMITKATPNIQAKFSRIKDSTGFSYEEISLNFSFYGLHKKILSQLVREEKEAEEQKE